MQFENLIEENIHIAKKLAKNLSYKYRGILTEDEIFSSASFGLLKAAQEYHDLPQDKFLMVARSCMFRQIFNELKRERTFYKKHKSSLDVNIKSSEYVSKIHLEDLCLIDRTVIDLLCSGKSREEILDIVGINSYSLKKSIKRILRFIRADEVSDAVAIKKAA